MSGPRTGISGFSRRPDQTSMRPLSPEPPDTPAGCCPPTFTTHSSTSPTPAMMPGALLLRGVPVGDLPPTPPAPSSAEKLNNISEFALLTVARRLGQPVGYAPEHGGDLVQNISPVARDARAPGLHLVEVHPRVPHRGGVSPAPSALSAAAVPQGRSGGSHDAVLGSGAHRRAEPADRAVLATPASPRLPTSPTSVVRRPNARSRGRS